MNFFWKRSIQWMWIYLHHREHANEQNTSRIADCCQCLHEYQIGGGHRWEEGANHVRRNTGGQFFSQSQHASNLCNRTCSWTGWTWQSDSDGWMKDWMWRCRPREASPDTSSLITCCWTGTPWSTSGYQMQCLLGEFPALAVYVYLGNMTQKNDWKCDIFSSVPLI